MRPGVTTLARLVGKVRDDPTRRLWAQLPGLPGPGPRYVLDQLVEVPPGARGLDLARWRTSPPPPGSGPGDHQGAGPGGGDHGGGLADLGAEVRGPPRRLGELAKDGRSVDACPIRRHPAGRRWATLLATVWHLQATSVDDTVELRDLLMTTELVGRAQTAADTEKVRKHRKLATASARLAVAVEALVESDGGGGPQEEPRVWQVWEASEAVICRAELPAALVLVTDNVPPADAVDPDDWRSQLQGR